jgi:tetrahydromethanopterin S-methyltransferase subunit E
VIKLDRAVTLGAAVAAPVLALLVDEHVLSALQATDLGAIVATFVGAYHLPNDAARANAESPAVSPARILPL